MNGTGDKYKMFRNYMANELGISKADIKEWTMEAVHEIAERQVGQLNIREMVYQHIRDNHFNTRGQLVSEVAKELTKRLTIIDEKGVSHG